MLFAEVPPDEFDVKMDAFVGEVRPFRPTLLNDEQQTVVGEQRHVVVNRSIVPVEIVCER